MLSLAKFIKKEIELRENLVGTGFIDPPPQENRNSKDAVSRVTVLGEIVQASGFESENVYIMYDTFITDGWTFEDNNEYELSSALRDEHDESNRR
jgi:hypothetical protein